MTENTGNAYRTKQAVVAAFVLIAAAAAILVIGLTDIGAAGALGVFLLIVGIGMAVLSLMFSGEPDKFGPSEKVYRLDFGLILAIIGLICIMISYHVAWYAYVAVLLIGIAIVGLLTALSNSKKTKY